MLTKKGEFINMVSFFQWRQVLLVIMKPHIFIFHSQKSKFLNEVMYGVSPTNANMCSTTKRNRVSTKESVCITALCHFGLSLLNCNSIKNTIYHNQSFALIADTLTGSI